MRGQGQQATPQLCQEPPGLLSCQLGSAAPLGQLPLLLLGIRFWASLPPCLVSFSSCFSPSISYFLFLPSSARVFLSSHF